MLISGIDSQAASPGISSVSGPARSHHDKDNHHVVLLRLLFCNEGLGFCLYV